MTSSAVQRFDPDLIEVTVHGEVSPTVVDYARKRFESVLSRIDEPVLFARLKLTQPSTAMRGQPVLAQGTIDINGQQIRAQVSATELGEAADLLKDRLLAKLEERDGRRLARRRIRVAETGEWRLGSRPTARPTPFDRPAEERELVRHKTLALEEVTPDEAAFDMDQLDFDFFLFRELATGQDALLERLGDDEFRLTRLSPVEADPGPTAISLTVSDQAPPTATVQEAIARLDAGGEPFVFFADRESGRGHIAYRRYDGNYGLITPE